MEEIRLRDAIGQMCRGSAPFTIKGSRLRWLYWILTHTRSTHGKGIDTLLWVKSKRVHAIWGATRSSCPHFPSIKLACNSMRNLAIARWVSTTSRVG